MGIFKKAGKVLKKAGKQLSTNINHLPDVAAQVGTIGATPAVAMFSSVGTAMTAAAPVIGQASGILRENPELAGLAGSAFGIPGLGGLFGGGGELAQAPMGGQFTGQAVSPSIPVWLWIVAGLAGALGLFLLLRKK